MVYGPGNKGNMLSLLSAARRRLRLPLKGATGKRSIIYVGNVCNAVGAIMDRHADHAEMAAVFNLTDETDRTSAELYAAIYQGINGAPGIFYFPPGFIRLIAGLNGRSKAIVARLFDDYRFSSSKFQTEYQWRPVFSFLEGITATVTWYQTARIS
jgi:UDP-glucose 4-epimerase